MKKSCLALLLCMSMMSTACGSSAPQSSSPEPVSTEAAAQTEASSPVVEETEAASISETETEAAPMVEVDEGLFDVELTVSAEFMGEVTQEELDASVAENGYKSATLNEDGSVTYVMNKKQHKELLEEMKSGIREALDEMVGSTDYPNITAIECNDDMSYFKVVTKNEELDLAESFSTLAFYLYGGMYKAFEGEEIEDIVIDYVNADSGEVISSASYAESLNSQP